MNIRRRIASGLLAGLAAGLFLGVTGRMVMRLLALAGGMRPGFSIEATLGVLLIGVIIGLVSGLIYAVLRAFLPPFRGQGILYGLLWMGVLALLNQRLIQEEIASAADGRVMLVAALALFTLVFVIFGTILEMVSKRVEMGVPAPVLE